MSSTVPSAGPPSKWTAQEVIEIFKGLGLPVCDDWPSIEAKVKAQRDRFLRDKNSTDPAIRARASTWFKNSDALQNARGELLRAVNEQFIGLAKTALAAAIAAGVKTVTPELLEQIADLARSSCKTDDALTDLFVTQFCKAENLAVGKPPATAQLVTNFTTDSGNPINLRWAWPSHDCDKIEIEREAETGRGRAETIYRGTGTACVDTDVEAGVWYDYRVYSFNKGIRSEQSAHARAVAIGDVKNASAAFVDGVLHVKWDPAGIGSSTFVFRRAGGAPQVRIGSNGPEAADSETTLVQRGGASTWLERSLVEGATYHYQLIAEFGAGLWSRGIEVRATVPTAPPPVPRASATHQRDAQRDAIVIAWDPIPGGLPVEHVVVRHDGNVPASRPEDGLIVGVTPQHTHVDTAVDPGRRYTYTVFARSGGLVSRSGAVTPPVDVLAEVTGLSLRAGSAVVELAWTAPANITSVVVRRSLSEPRDHADGTLVGLSGPEHAKDEGLHNGRRYHYLVCCGYRPDGVQEVFSPGVRASAVPDELPDPVASFEAHAESAEVVCTWTKPKHGLVVVVRSAQPHGLAAGARIPVEEVDRHGERIASGEDRASDAQPDLNKPYYSAFTIAGSSAAVGGVAVCAATADVTDLRLLAIKEGIILRWVWPRDCAMVRIARRAEAWPEGPDDPQAKTFACSRTEFQAAGSKYVDAIEKGRARLHYVVYAQATGAPGAFFSPGVSSGSRQVIQWQPWMTLRYHLDVADKPPHKGQAVHLRFSTERTFPDFSGFALVASHTGIPTDIDDGLELARWEPSGKPADGDHELHVNLEPVRRKRWARFFAKAFVIDPAQRPTALVIHPDTSRPLSPDSGGVMRSETSDAVRTYKAGVPSSVVCPLCFEEFGLEKMLFSSFSGGEPIPGKYGWLEKMKGEPPQPPTNKQGQRLTQKHCPNKHVLPFTAGAQASLVIGLIGAKFSGKSHYIASLVKRLEAQVGSDLQAALLPVSDETQDRYRREFHDPLFGKSLELPLTVGTPPPLIYDLTLDGALWKEKRTRAVTLALYDTAGENLDSQDTVQQMLRYLRVASGIMFLIDPLQAPAVRDALPPSIRPPDVDAMAEPNVILSRVLQVLENGRVLARSGPMSTPVAVVLTKCDVLKEANLIEPNRLWNTDARHVGYFDRHAHDDMSGMMAEYVQRYCPAAYNIVTQRFARHAFFGVSATGCASDQATRRYKYISPWRVEDPLLWLLSELAVIPAQ